MGTISIILVNWNGMKWVDKCLSSLNNQTYKNFEIIFVDNDSTDNSVKYVSNNYPSVKILKSNQNLGFAGGNNLGIKEAIGKLVLLLNTDTWLDNTFLQEITDFYINNNYQVVAPLEADYYTRQERSLYTSKIDLLGHPIYQQVKNSEAIASFYLTGACLLFPKDMYLKTNGLDNDFFMYCEEVDWFWRLNLLNIKFTYISNVYVYHASAGSGTKGLDKKTFLWRNQNTLQMLLKNYKLGTLLVVIPIYLFLNVIEIIFFLLILKPKIAISYIQGWIFNIFKLASIVNKRKYIQEERILTDMDILKRMYIGSSKLMHLVNYFRRS